MRKILLTIALLALAGGAGAVDYWGGPPEGTWMRGEALSTWTHLYFSNPADPNILSESDNPNCPPWVSLEGDWEWGEWDAPPELDPNGYVDGWHCFFPDGGVVRISICNFPDPQFVKYIFIQITSSKAPSDVSVSGSGAAGPYVTGSWPTGKPHIQWPGAAPYGGVWYTYNYGRYIMPNPESEDIIITVPYCTVIDQVVIDTICTDNPEIPTETGTWGEMKTLFR